MRLGLSLGYQTAWSTPADHLALAQEADRLGFSVVWAAEAYGSDAPEHAVLDRRADRPDRCGRGHHADPGPYAGDDRDDRGHHRHLLRWAVPARSGCVRSAGLRGLARRAVRQAARAHPRVCRDRPHGAGSADRVRIDGEFYTLPLPDGPGKALKLGFHPHRADIPIYLAAVGPQNLELAGEIADGWLAGVLLPRARGRPARGGGRRDGPGPDKTLADFDVVPTVPVVIGDDVAACADQVRWYAALYLGGMGSREKNFYNQLATRMGFGDAAREVQDLYLDQRQRDAAAAVPMEFIDRDVAARPDRTHRRQAAGVCGRRRHDAVAEPVRGRPRVRLSHPSRRSRSVRQVRSWSVMEMAQ